MWKEQVPTDDTQHATELLQVNNYESAHPRLLRTITGGAREQWCRRRYLEWEEAGRWDGGPEGEGDVESCPSFCVGVEATGVWWGTSVKGWRGVGILQCTHEECVMTQE